MVKRSGDNCANAPRSIRNGARHLRLVVIICSVLFTIVFVISFFRSAALARGAADNQDTRPRRATEPQEEKPLRLSVDLVSVLTTVSDSTGNYATDLTEKDFEIYEENVRHDLAGLYLNNDLPLRMVFLFDASSSIKHRFDFEQRAASRFFKQLMRPGDQAAILSVSTDPRMEIQFTFDVNKIIAALSSVKVGGATSLYSALVEAARYLRPAEGRRVIVALSDGSDTASASTLTQALAEVQRSDAVVYAVNSTGAPISANNWDLAAEVALKTMTEDTGGRAFFPVIHRDAEKEARELDEIYRRIAAEVRAQYVLTYYSKNAERDGRFRSIRIEVKRPGFQVRARRGYYSPGP